MPKLRMHTYAGDSRVVAEGEMDAIRAAAAAAIRCHRTKFGYPVTELAKDRKWELESDPEGGHMVSDHEGILEITENDRCSYCGNEVPDDAFISSDDMLEGSVYCDVDCASRDLEFQMREAGRLDEDTEEDEDE
jgi:hypothetical protein